MAEQWFGAGSSFPTFALVTVGAGVGCAFVLDRQLWRGVSGAGTVVIIGLVDKGHGTLKPYLIREMIKQLRENGFVT